MKKQSILKKALFIILPLAIIAIMVIKLKSNKKTAQTSVYLHDKNQPVHVQTDTIRIEDVNEELSYTGTFEPDKETKLSSEIQGKINTILVDVGSYVNKGQALIQLDNSLLKLQLQTIDIQIEGLIADVNRYTILAKADAIQGIQLEKSELGLKSAKVQKAALAEQINKTTIKAPFNGVVTAKLNEVGAFASPGIPLLQITDITHLKFTIHIAEQELKNFLLNKNYSIIPDAYPDHLFSGKVIMKGSKANAGNSFPIQLEVTNTSDLKIKSGMFGKVEVKNPQPEKGIVISTSVIISSDGQSQVYLIKNGKSVLHDITISKKVKNQAVVSDGLHPGDIIVSNGFINLFDSANVFVK